MTANSLQETSLPTRYEHVKYEKRRKVLRFLLRTLGFTLLARVDQVEGIENVPASGPALLMINHIAFIDPIVVLHLLPRNIIPMAKIEVYEYPVVGIFPKLWGVIPVRREEVDRRAIQQTLEVLRAGEIVLVAPEGTRGPALKEGKEGVAYLASRSAAPVVPVAISGTIGYPTLRGSRTWRRGGAHVRFGRPFRYRSALRRASREDLRQMTDEAMYLIAAMLPPEQRGVYAELEKATVETIEWV